MQKYKILKKLREREIGRGRFVEYLIELPDKSRAKFVRRYADDVAAVVGFLKKDTVIMVREYRFGADRTCLQFPAGLTDGQSPKRAAMREFHEEAGYKAKNLELLCVFNITPAWNKQKEYVYIADTIVKDKQHLERYEFIEAEEIKIKNIPKLIEKGEICDAATIAAYHFLVKKRPMRK